MREVKMNLAGMVWIILLAGVAGEVTAQRRDLVLRGGGQEVTTLPDQKKRYALLIGVNSYDDPQITPLAGAANDMNQLEKALVTYAGFDQKRIIRLTTDATEAVDKPTYGNVYQKLSNILKAVPNDGLLVLAFSGHGIERDGRAFLLPSDARVNEDIELLKRTSLEVASIREMIENRKNLEGGNEGIGQVIVLLDACRNNPTSGKDPSINPLTRAYDFNLRNSNVKAFATIYATSRGARAYENRSRRQGYFIGEVVAGLSGEAANGRGEVTLGGLISYIEDEVPNKVTMELGQTQRPYHDVEGYKPTELVIAVNPAAVADRQSAVSRVQPVLAVGETAARKEETKLSIFATRQFTTGEMRRGMLEPTEGTCDVYTEDLGNGVRIEMVRIPGGAFMMGSPESENGRTRDEGPQRQVRVREFLMGRYEVTQRIWRLVAGYPKVSLDLPLDPSRFKGDDLPVESISWLEAKEFVTRLNRKLGLAGESRYRLPAEAEWEYAARAGTTTPFAFGGTIDPEFVNYDGNYPYGIGNVGRHRNRTVVVGSLGMANRWGLYDMYGNVWEWCDDDYHNNYKGAPGDGRVWMSVDVTVTRVLRGGSWDYGAVNCRSAYRDRSAPINRSDGVGFRLSRTLP